jgi:hypothetical protein
MRRVCSKAAVVKSVNSGVGNGLPAPIERVVEARVGGPWARRRSVKWNRGADCGQPRKVVEYYRSLQ